VTLDQLDAMLRSRHLAQEEYGELWLYHLDYDSGRAAIALPVSPRFARRGLTRTMR